MPVSRLLGLQNLFVDARLSIESALGRNRTYDQEIRRLLLYPLSYEGKAARPASSLLVLFAALFIQVVPVLGDCIDERLRLLLLRQVGRVSYRFKL